MSFWPGCGHCFHLGRYQAMIDTQSRIFSFYQAAKRHLFLDDTLWLRDLVERHRPCLDYIKLKHHEKIISHSLDNSDRAINVFVVGEGNFGKSSLINAIIEGSVAKVDFLPTTWCLHRYLFGQPEAVVFYTDGTAVRVSHAEAQQRLQAEETRQRENKAYQSGLFQIDWFYDNYPRLASFIIVDTPGLFQVNNQWMQRSIEEFYYRADAVLWVFDATKINRENSYQALRQISRFAKKTIGVINKWDSISAESYERILTQAEAAFGQYVQSFQPVSARRALEAVEAGDDRKMEMSLLPDLLEKVNRLFLANYEVWKNISLYNTACLVFAAYISHPS